MYHPDTPLATPALEDVSFEVLPGEWVSVVGHTGSGKSTLAQHLNALFLPQQGRVTVDGMEVKPRSKELREIRRRVGLVFQYPEQQLFAETVEEEVAFGPRNWNPNADVKPLVEKALRLVNLDLSFLSTSPFLLSGGQKRRVAIASVLASEPRYLVLDEPTAGLDCRGIKDLMKLLETLLHNGMAVVHITHDLELAFERSDRILVLEEGRVVVWGKPEKVAERLLAQPIKGLVLPPIMEVCRLLQSKGMDIPLTWEVGRLVREIERRACR